MFKIRFREPHQFKINFGSVTFVEHGFNPYEGPYEVIPKFYDQTLETDDKSMTDDVLVHQIPVEIVPNGGGGNTVTIGG